jgi:hypothetical protein
MALRPWLGRRGWASALCAVAVMYGAAAATPATRNSWFVHPPTRVGNGRSIQFAEARGRVWTAYSAAAPAASASSAPAGQDLWLAEVDTATSRLAHPRRINRTPGELLDTNENSPLLLKAPDASALYVVWVGIDPRHTLANRLLVSRFDFATGQISLPVVVNDDPVRATHNFHGAAVGPHGEIVVAWLDRRHNDMGGPREYPGGGDQQNYREVSAALYVARSTDGGRSFSANHLLARAACACCRVSVAFSGPNMMVVWRGVQTGQIRDILVARSTDGAEWSTPVPVSRDGWVIAACPHAGPSLIANGKTVHVAWMTGQSGEPVLYVARSTDGGETFGPRVEMSTGIAHPGAPLLLADRDRAGRAALLFYGGTPDASSAIWYRDVPTSGALPSPWRVSPQDQRATYPSAIAHAGELIAGWLDRAGGENRLFITHASLPHQP